MGGQQIFHRLLQADVKGEHHVVAGLGLLALPPGGVDDLPGGIGLDLPGAAGAVEIGLKGLFHAGFTHPRVIGIAQLPVAGRVLVALPLL